MDEADPLRENLANVAADLLSYRRFRPIVRRIFAAPAGVWQTVASCCSGAVELPGSAAGVFAGHADRFVVTYLPWPGLPADDPGCMVVFAHDEELWSSIAFFNRASLKDE
jgi:hypothetical protein